MEIRLLRVEEIHWAVLAVTEIFTLTRLEYVETFAREDAEWKALSVGSN